MYYSLKQQSLLQLPLSFLHDSEIKEITYLCITNRALRAYKIIRCTASFRLT
jgi:hypothetical protein